VQAPPMRARTLSCVGKGVEGMEFSIGAQAGTLVFENGAILEIRLGRAQNGEPSPQDGGCAPRTAILTVPP
jgi:hypothetical protein